MDYLYSFEPRSKSSSARDLQLLRPRKVPAPPNLTEDQPSCEYTIPIAHTGLSRSATEIFDESFESSGTDETGTRQTDDVQPLTAENLATLSGPAPRWYRHPSLFTVSSLRTDSSFFQKGNLHPRLPSESEENDDEFMALDTAAYYQAQGSYSKTNGVNDTEESEDGIREEEESSQAKEDHTDENEDDISSIAHGRAETAYRYTTSTAPRHTPPVERPHPLEEPSSPGGYNLRLRTRASQLTPPYNFVCKTCRRGYIKRVNAERHERENPGHFLQD